MKMPRQRFLRHVVVFDAPRPGDDGMGNHVADGWEQRFEARAEIMYLRGGETVVASRLAGRQPAVVTVLSGPDSEAVPTTWRIRDVLTGRAFAIQARVPTDDMMFIEFTCSEMPAHGQGGLT